MRRYKNIYDVKFLASLNFIWVFAKQSSLNEMRSLLYDLIY